MILLLLVAILAPLCSAENWWNTAWASRKEINISSAVDLDNYQYMLYLSLGNSNGSDIRFTYLNQSTGSEIEIPFWRVSNQYIETIWDYELSHGNVVVKVPRISSVEQNKVYVYFNAQKVSDKSNAKEVYDLFDDFDGFSLDSNQWETYWNGGLQYSISQGILHVSGVVPPNLSSRDGTITGWHSKKAYGLGTVLETRVSIDHGKGYNYNGDQIGYGYLLHPLNGSAAAFMEIDENGANSSGYILIEDPAGEGGSSYLPDTDFNEWKFIRRNSTSHTAVIGSFLNRTYTTNVPTVPLPVTIAGSCYSNGAFYVDYYVDYVFVRKWSDHEPTYSVGSESCYLFGDEPPCGQISLQEVVYSIYLWSNAQTNLQDVIALINKWATG